MKHILDAAKEMHLNKNYDDALKFYLKILNSKWIKQNKNFKNELLQLTGILFIQLKKYEDALSILNQSIVIDSKNSTNFYNKGLALQELGRLVEAEDCYHQAIDIKPDYAAAYSNLGTVAKELKKYSKAIEFYLVAIKIDSSNYRNYSNIALILMDGELYEDALQYINIAISHKTNDYQLFINKGHILYYLKRYTDSLQCYTQAYNLQPDEDWLSGLVYFGKLLICDWDSIDEIENKIISNSSKGKLEIDPFKALSLCDDPAVQREIAFNYFNSKYKLDKEINDETNFSFTNEKHKIAYYSSDFYNHATMHLMLELFGMHDANEFEIYVFNYGLNKEDVYTLEIKNNNLTYLNVSSWTDSEIANYSKEIGIDIAIDLKGYTSHSRVGIFSNRCAKVQINFLGFPGTMGVDCYDYIVADEVIIPPSKREYYSEKIIEMPGCYQVNNSIKTTPDLYLSKTHYGLPNIGFIYTCFNNNYKIKGDIFKAWMDILNAVDGSVLWLLQDNEYASVNLRAEAEKYGIDARRIIFAPRAETPEHLYRHRFADLALDTFPVNAHTTASDALKNSLPILTYCGKSFASRVAASLLTSLNLNELITYSLDEYKEKAIHLGRNPVINLSIKSKLNYEIDKSNLFRPDIFIKNLETEFVKLLSEKLN
jgi:predicted O-linked N-acetylglucosamine transferase (SPINDLY family)